MGTRFKYISLLLLWVGLQTVAPPASQAQSDLTNALRSIDQNNKGIRNARQKAEAQKLLSQTGNAPDDPFISGDYLLGRPVEGGNQVDIIATQAFDFPTAYSKRAQLTRSKAAIYDLEAAQTRQSVLWEAQQIGLHLIYLNKKRDQHRQRAAEASQMLETLQAQMKAGEVSPLETNKAQLWVLQLEHRTLELDLEIRRKAQQLTALNGGLQITMKDTLYPDWPSFPEFDSLETIILRNDLEYQWEQANILVREKEIEVSKALNLPQLEPGYHYQSVLGQTFNGIHLGMSLPLWSNRKKVKAGQSLLIFQEQEARHVAHHLEAEIEKLYRQWEMLTESMTAYREALNGISTRQILDLLLQNGEIDFISYSREMDYYYDAYDTLLEIEHRYHLTIAELLKYQLLEIQP